MSTKDYRTKTFFLKRRNMVRNNNYWPIGLDIGYSSIKGMSPNMVYSFPSYAKKNPAGVLELGQPENTDILYRDAQTGEEWSVGERAQNAMSLKSSNETSESLYGRNRYFSEMFLVLARTGLAIGMMQNSVDSPAGKKIVVQTGLPSGYLEDDTPLIKEALAGNHNFDVKVGGQDWRHFEFTLAEDDIRAMQQPMGTLLSITATNDGKHTPDAKRIMGSNLLVWDTGFGTLDVCNICDRHIDIAECFTSNDLGMKRILQETCDELKAKYGVTNISVPTMQPCLASGQVRYLDRKNRKSMMIGFEDILQEKGRKIFLETLRELMKLYNDFLTVDYIVMTGGLGEPWYPLACEELKDMGTLTILPGNRNDNIPCIFSNVRGYYLFLVNSLR